MSVLSFVVVHVVHFFLHIEFVGSVIGVNQYVINNVSVELKPIRQSVIRVPAVLKLAGIIGTRAVFAVQTGFQSRFNVSELEIMTVVYISRRDMLVQFGELTADTIDTHGFVCTVGTLDEAAVGQITVGIRITDAPVELIGIKRMFAGKLRVVCSAAGIVVFHIIDIIGLGVESGTFRIAVFGYLIENVLKFITVTAVSRLKGEIQHSAQTHIITVLVICCFA